MLILAGQSGASSFVALPSAPLSATPSIIALGEAAAPAIEARPLASMPADAEVYMLSSSIVAFGAEAIPTAREEVASIPETATQPAWMSSALPLIIRGGEQGDAFAAPSPEDAGTAEPAARPL